MKKILILATSAVPLLAACSDSNDDGGTTGTTGASGGSGGAEAELIVSAASSLTEAFGKIGSAFEAANPGTTVTFNFGPSDGLANQINEGAPVDVFASASPTWMDSVQDDGPGVTDRADFAQNRLAIIVPADNPAGIENLNDLTEDGVQLVLAAEGVPAGDYAREIFENAGLEGGARQRRLERGGREGRDHEGKLGDADAGIGYVTDVTPDVADQITLIPIPDEVNVIATYPIAVVNGSQEADLAQGFVEYVLGDGQQTLADTASSPLRRGRIPAGFVVLAALGVALVALPLLGLVLRTPWSRIAEILTSETALTALRLSLTVATIAAAISFILGFPLAWVLVRSTFPGKTLVRAVVVLPLVMPPVVAGVGLLAAFGRRSGLIGSLLYDWFGSSSPSRPPPRCSRPPSSRSPSRCSPSRPAFGASTSDWRTRRRPSAPPAGTSFAG